MILGYIAAVATVVFGVEWFKETVWLLYGGYFMSAEAYLRNFTTDEDELALLPFDLFSE